MYSVLYVDDDPALLDIGKIYLDMSGNFSVDTSGSVSEAMEMIRQKRYDAIVSDYEMAEINGIEFLRYVRQQFKDLPFILFTGRGREDIVIEAINNGADFYLQKGGEPKAQFAELDYKIRTAIDRRRVQVELQESRKQLSDLINFLPDATFAIDLKGRVIVWNRMMEELTGVPPDAVMGTGNLARKLPLYEEKRPPLADYIVHAEGDPQKEYPNLKRNGDKLLAEMYHPPQRQNGKGSYFWHTASPLYDVTGHIIGAIESVRDVTQRKETEEKLKCAHDELNAAYEQLTATEEEIRQNYDELEKSEELIRQSEERFRNVIEDQTEFICRFTPDGKLSFVNNAYCRYFGLDPDTCIGKPHTVTIPKEDAVQMQQQLASLTPATPVASISNRILMPNGSVRWQRWSDRAIFDSAGRIIEIQSVGRDITNEKEAEDKLKQTYEELNAAYEQLTATEEELRQNYDELNKSQTELHGAYEQLTAIEEELRSNFEELALTEQSLRQSEVRYRNVVEDQTEFICRFTPDGKLSFVNNAYCRHFGLDPDSCIGKPHPVTIPKEDRARMKEQFSRITPDNPVEGIDHRIILPSGEMRWHHWHDRAIFDANGRVLEYQSVGRDITDQKLAEEKLRQTYEDMNAAYEQLTATEEELRQNYDELARSEERARQSEERYRNVVEDQTEFVCRFTPEGKLTFVNEAYCRYFGLDRTTCIGQPHTVTIPPADLSRMKVQLSQITPENPIAIIEHQILMPSGEIRWQRWSDRAIFDKDGHIIEYQSVGRDTTDRVIAEEKLQFTNVQLHSAYEEVTATEEELRQNYDELGKSQTELHGAYEQLTAIEEELRSNFEELALTEQSLRQSEERFRNVIEDQTEFICRFTPDGKLSFVNNAYCRYFGLDPESCIGKHHTVSIPKEDAVQMRQQMAELTPENPVTTISNRILMPDGSVRWQQWSDRAIFDNTGRIIEIQSVGRDITSEKEQEDKLKQTYEELHSAYEQLTATEEELRQNYDELGKSQTELHATYEQLTAVEEELRSNFEELALSEQSLRQSEDRYRNVIEDQTEFICRFTPEGKLSFVNNAYCRYFDLDPESCVGKSHLVSIPKEDRALMKEKLAQLTPAQPLATIDHRIIMPSGEVRWHHWSDRAIFDTAGRIIEYQSVGRDITERRRMEQALEESNKKLNLLSSITRHDILNQLTALQGSLGLLELEIANPDQLRLLAKAIQSSDVIQSQILFTQQYQDIGVKKPRWQNLHAAVTTVCMDNGYSNVAIDPALNEWEVYADPLLRMVFLNLFDNASMHGGKVTGIRVGGEKTADGFVIAVEDDGDGVPPEDKKRIFQKGVGKHTGLGLFLVQEVLAITGLTISETGEYQKGARFDIHVPVGTFRNVHHELNS